MCQHMKSAVPVSLHPGCNLWSRSRLLPSTSTKVASHLVSCDLQSRLWMLLYSRLPIAELNSGLPIANYLELRPRHVEQRSTWNTWNRGARGTREPREIRGHEDYKVKPKRNHCHGHTPQAQKGPYPRIQKGLKRPTLAWNEIQFVTPVSLQATCPLCLPVCLPLLPL